jgi:hypothetical protein
MSLQLIRSKPINLSGQPKTRVIQQKPESDPFFFNSVFSPTLDPLFFHIF